MEAIDMGSLAPAVTATRVIDQENLEPIRWDIDPVFAFDNEVDAMKMLLALADQLETAREQVDQVMRYMTKAVRAARGVIEDGKPTSKQAIINHSGLARQTVYDILGEAQ